MGKKSFARDPLLYIHQSKIYKTEAPMQSRYMTPKREKGIVANNSKPTNSAGKSPINKSAFHKQLEQPKAKLEKSATMDNETTADEEKPKDKKDRDESVKFKEMTLEKKIAYLVDSSSYAPKMRCEVRTEEKTYRGIIIDKKDNDIFIQIGKRASSTKISIAEIKSIRMLGF